MDPIQQPEVPQQQVPQMPTPEVFPASHRMRNFLLTFLLLLIVAGGSYYLGTKNATLTTVNSNTPSQEVNKTGYTTQQTTLSATPTPDPTASWKLYTNTKYSYSIKYPQGLMPNEQNTYYHYVEFKDTTAVGQLPAYVVSVIPSTFIAKDPAAYNYMSSDWINNINNLQVGETKTLDSAATFTRLANTTINGQVATVITVNATGYKQERIYVQNKGNIYMISNYYTTPEELNNFAFFLSTFRFIQ